MNKVTAREFLKAYNDARNALNRVNKRLGKLSDKELETYPDEIDDLVYFVNSLTDVVKDLEYRAEEAEKVLGIGVNHLYNT